MWDLRSEAIQRKLLIEENLTPQRAYEIAHSMETANRQASELQASTKMAVVAKDIQRVAPLKPGNADPPCYRCGKTGQSLDKCFFKSQKCRACGNRGHIAKMCKAKESEKGTLKQSTPRPRSFLSRQPEGQAYHRAGYMERDKPKETSEALDGPDQDYQLFAVKSAPEAAIILEPKVNGVILPKQLDTGASVCIISQKGRNPFKDSAGEI